MAKLVNTTSAWLVLALLANNVSNTTEKFVEVPFFERVGHVLASVSMAKTVAKTLVATGVENFVNRISGTIFTTTGVDVHRTADLIVRDRGVALFFHFLTLCVLMLAWAVYAGAYSLDAAKSEASRSERALENAAVSLSLKCERIVLLETHCERLSARHGNMEKDAAKERRRREALEEELTEAKRRGEVVERELDQEKKRGGTLVEKNRDLEGLLCDLNDVVIPRLKADRDAALASLKEKRDELVEAFVELGAADVNLQDAMDELRTAKKRLNGTKKALRSCEVNLEATQIELYAVERAFAVVCADLQAAKTELAGRDQELQVAEEDLVATKAELAQTKVALHEALKAVDVMRGVGITQKLMKWEEDVREMKARLRSFGQS